MKYILLMCGTKAGVNKYHAWPPKDIEAHLASLRAIAKERLNPGSLWRRRACLNRVELRLCAGKKGACRLHRRL
jgi:hypothetical protein